MKIRLARENKSKRGVTTKSSTSLSSFFENDKRWVQYPDLCCCFIHIWIIVIPLAVIIPEWLREKKEGKRRSEDRWSVHFSDLPVWKRRACNCQIFETGRICTQNRTNLPTSLQFHDLRLHNPHNQQDVSAPSLYGKFWLHRNGCRPFQMQQTLCYNVIHPCLTLKEGPVAFRSNSWDLCNTQSAATFTHAFTCTPATTQPDVLFIVHPGDSAFT